MDNSTLLSLGLLLLFLIACSAFFSSAETALMSINRYRLRHLVREKNRLATKVQHLLERPDRLLGVILIGNTFANIMASSIATILAVSLLGDWGVFLATILLTLVVLVLGEVAPKTLAAQHPQKVSFFVVWPLTLLLKLLYPVVWMVNGVSNGLLRLCRVDLKKKTLDHLSSDELRTIVLESANQIPTEHQDMLLRILDLEKMTVDDVMVPRNEIAGIELNDSWEDIQAILINSQFSHLYIYRDGLDNVQGILNLRSIMHRIGDSSLNTTVLESIAKEVYYVPEGTPLTAQLINFRKEQQQIALVVDEYGDIQGLVSIDDILEEIVGEMTSEVPSVSKFVTDDKNGAYIVDGSVNVRELNRLMNWAFPTEGPKTLSGLIIEYLEMIPQEYTCLRLNGYPMEIMSVQANMVKTVKIFPELLQKHEDI